MKETIHHKILASNIVKEYNKLNLKRKGKLGYLSEVEIRWCICYWYFVTETSYYCQGDDLNFNFDKNDVACITDHLSCSSEECIVKRGKKCYIRGQCKDVIHRLKGSGGVEQININNQHSFGNIDYKYYEEIARLAFHIKKQSKNNNYSFIINLLAFNKAFYYYYFMIFLFNHEIDEKKWQIFQIIFKLSNKRKNYILFRHIDSDINKNSNIMFYYDINGNIQERFSILETEITKFFSNNYYANIRREDKSYLKHLLCEYFLNAKFKLSVIA